MSVPKERQSRLGIGVGCVLALVFVARGSANAQVVQTAGENQAAILGTPAQLVASESSHLTSRRLMVQFPQTGDPSPSDVSTGRDDPDTQKSGLEKTDDKKADDEKLEEKSSSDGRAKQPEAETGITPVQSAGLKLNVAAVNISTTTIGTGLLPDNTAALRASPSTSLLDGQSRGVIPKHVNWRPASVCHLPLYFEDAMLERHGHVRWGCAQPLASGVKFLTTLPLLPYITTLHPKCEPRYALGHFRPGSCAPALKDHLPWDQRAAVVETVSLGAFFWAAPL